MSIRTVTYLHGLLWSSLRSLGGSALETRDHGCTERREIRSKSVSGFVSLLDETSNDSAGGLVLVESLGELLTNVVELLLEGEGFQHKAVPFVLEGIEESWDTGGLDWTWLGDGGAYTWSEREKFLLWTSIKSSFDNSTPVTGHFPVASMDLEWERDERHGDGREYFKIRRFSKR